MQLMMKSLLINAILCVFIVSCGGSGGNAEVAPATPDVIVDDSTTDNSDNNSDSGDEGVESPVNILLIISDDQGVDASAQYNYSSDLPHTETLNTLANEGVVFSNAWATPACTTTRATILTGKHGVNSGVTYVPALLDTSLQTLPKYLKADTVTSHYEMAVFGKWHLGSGQPLASHPNDSGVEHYAGNLGNLDDYYNWDLTVNGATSAVTEYHTSKLTDLAIDWIGEQSQPWFVWLAYSAPHSPFHLPPAHLHNREYLTGTDAHIKANKREYYLAAIEAMDSEIGRLINAIPTAEQDNTVIIYIGDNGTPKAVIDVSTYDSNHSKGTLFEGGIRVPLLVSGKGVSRSNEVETALINSTDIFATISELAGSTQTSVYDSHSFAELLISANSENEQSNREYNYSEFETSSYKGWAVRNATFKLIQYDSGEQALFNIENDLTELDDLLLTDDNYHDVVALLTEQGLLFRQQSSTSAEDITNKIFTARNANCADYVNSYSSNVLDVNNSTVFMGDLTITAANNKCSFHTNAIPNHDFNDGDNKFPNDVSAQNDMFEITSSPSFAASTTAISLQTDNALLLNGVKVDVLAAGCFGVGNGKVGCNDMSQPWRYDPMVASSGFKVDSHNAHAQPDGTYHYHGTPNAFYHAENNGSASPVVGFSADGFPIFGPYFEYNGTVRKALSSYKIKSGTRPTEAGSPGGHYDGTYRDDNEYVQGLGDLDECNGMTIDGVYGYYITDTFPYVLNCFKGTPDTSFNK